MQADRGAPGNSKSKESRRDSRIAVAGIIVNAVAVIISAVVGAVAGAFTTAHNPQIIRVLGGNSKIAVTVPPGTPGPNNQVGSLPRGPAFTRGAVTINFYGLDLDRNPPENGNVSTGDIDVSQDSGPVPGLLFHYAMETVQWKQRGVPKQIQCHNDEIANGDPNFTFNLIIAQSSKTTVSFCILTSEGRDAYLVVHGAQVVSNQSTPAQVFVWPRVIPVS